MRKEQKIAVRYLCLTRNRVYVRTTITIRGLLLHVYIVTNLRALVNGNNLQTQITS